MWKQISYFNQSLDTKLLTKITYYFPFGVHSYFKIKFQFRVRGPRGPNKKKATDRNENASDMIAGDAGNNEVTNPSGDSVSIFGEEDGKGKVQDEGDDAKVQSRKNIQSRENLLEPTMPI